MSKRPASQSSYKTKKSSHTELLNLLRDELHMDENKAADFSAFYDKVQGVPNLRENANQTGIALNNDRVRSIRHRKPQCMASEETTSTFTNAIVLHEDFRQRTLMSRLKRLRKTQTELPIARYKEQILAALQKCRVMLIAGDTGCGKSTQVPQYIMNDLNPTGTMYTYGKVVCTQPRRIACVSLTKRVSYEMLSEYRSAVGYQIRFERQKRADTRLLFMTEGLLLRQVNDAETIENYDVIILDEVHERHLQMDFLVGIMKCLLHTSKHPFKLILMSATVNVELFASHFREEGVQVVRVPGRLYPIQIHYMPPAEAASGVGSAEKMRSRHAKLDCTPYLQIMQMIDSKYGSTGEKGDMLIFLNGQAEISYLAGVLEQYALEKNNWIILQLHSGLSMEQQDRVFDYPPDGVRKCIISTNIAETSITIDGIRFVIDSGKVNRMTHYLATTSLASQRSSALQHGGAGVHKLSETFISRDSAQQRAGRAGRTGPGVCYRLYSEQQYNEFDAYTPAEIHLVPLESILLQMINLGLMDVERFPFLERPNAQALVVSLDRLCFSGALHLQTGDNVTSGSGATNLQLTRLGEALSNLPVDLTIGKMLIMGAVLGQVVGLQTHVLALAALFTVPSPISASQHHNAEATRLREPYDSTHGDPMTLLNLFKAWLQLKVDKDSSTRAWCRKRGLEEQRFYETTKLIEQFRDILADVKLLSDSRNTDGTRHNDSAMTPAERKLRRGQLKHLKSLHHSLRMQSRANVRKQLKVFEYTHNEDEEQRGDDLNDVRDVELRIRNDIMVMHQHLLASQSYRTELLLKLIVCSGLYPNVAVEDEHNGSKTVLECLYHTRDKWFIHMRPISVFGCRPDLIRIQDSDIDVPPDGYFSRRPLSAKHQILLFHSILETRKTYAVQCIRMPALQTLLFLAKTITCDRMFTRFVFDDFLMFDCPMLGQGVTILCTALLLRKRCTEQINRRLNNAEVDDNADEVIALCDDLVSFFNGIESTISYNIRRLLPADIANCYVGHQDDYCFTKIKDFPNPFKVMQVSDGEDFVMAPDTRLGGIRLHPNLIYNCIPMDEYSSQLYMQWQNDHPSNVCNRCGKQMLADVLDQLTHEFYGCSAEHSKTNLRSQLEAKTSSSGAKKYTCDICNGTFYFNNAIEMLRHRKSCHAP